MIGIPDARLGQEVKAVVALKPGMTDGVKEEEIVEFCKVRIAAYKYPRTVDFVKSLPKTATGKIFKRELRHDGSASASAAAQ